ncbi:hypothetical protein M2351_003951 [Azospirillum canadense]|nr:hypothetical protein [Azospirillum canadense]
MFRQPLRQTEGLVSSLLALMELDLPVPHHCTLSRRAGTLAMAPAATDRCASLLRLTWRARASPANIQPYS